MSWGAIAGGAIHAKKTPQSNYIIQLVYLAIKKRRFLQWQVDNVVRLAEIEKPPFYTAKILPGRPRSPAFRHLGDIRPCI